MCECLLEGMGYLPFSGHGDETESIGGAVHVHVHATYQLGSEPVDPHGFTPPVKTTAELRAIWLAEDEL